MILHGIERFVYDTMRLYFNWWIILAHTQNERIITLTQEAYINLERGFYIFDRWRDDNGTARANDISDWWSSAQETVLLFPESLNCVVDRMIYWIVIISISI